MKLPRREFLRLASGVAAAPAVSRLAKAQTYPSRPITLIVPFAAGGPLDVGARIIAEGMRRSLGQPILIENIAGAAGSIALSRAVRAASDGYTLNFGGWGTHVVNGAIYSLPYDLRNDFEPISLVATVSFMIVAKKSMPADDLKGLVTWLKANADKATAGTAGIGSPQHISGVFFQSVTGSQFQHVPYRSGSLAMQDLVAGRIDLMIDNPTNSLPQVRGGLIKAYAVAGKSRLAAAPNIPTVDEAGLPGLYISVWTGLFAPKGTPTDVIAKLNRGVVASLAEPDVRARFADLGQEIFPREQQTPEALAAFQKAEIDKWWPIIKAAGIKAE